MLSRYFGHDDIFFIKTISTLGVLVFGFILLVS